MANANLLFLTTQIICAHLAFNAVRADDIPGLIRSVYNSLAGRSKASSKADQQADRPRPAVPIARSVFKDYIICLEDGIKLKVLKRHLQAAYGMTPEQYRERWGLGPLYPMVAPAYAERRSSLAKQSGLGTRGRRAEAG